MTLFKKCQKFFDQTSMRFHITMATLEAQKYVIARTVWTKNILLGSERLVSSSSCFLQLAESFELAHFCSE